MARGVDVYGHFGSWLSYATIAHNVCHALHDASALGPNVENLDDRNVGSMQTRRWHKLGRKVLLLSDPREYLVDMLCSRYGAENVGLFVCPNTDQLSADRADMCGKVGRVYTPSRWCATTILRQVPSAHVEVLPLGVDPTLVERAYRPLPPQTYGSHRILHMTSDTFWPGRKGTEALILALGAMRRDGYLLADGGICVTIHCLPQLYGSVYRLLGEEGLLDVVQLVQGQERGYDEGRYFADLFDKHDVLLAPSRSEGFGVLPLSALVYGMPVMTTAGTGQDQYLSEMSTTMVRDREVAVPNLNGWIQVPTRNAEPLAGEDGNAPVVYPRELEMTIDCWLHLKETLTKRAMMNRTCAQSWSWTARAQQWAEALSYWEASTEE